MFDFAWSEIGVIAVVALIFIGPKDMPVAIKGVSGAIKKARRMAAEFQGHVDDLVREADLQDVRDSLSGLRGLSPGRALEKFVDEDGSIRRTIEDPVLSGSLNAAMSSDTAPLDQAYVDVAERPDIGTDPDFDLEPTPPPAAPPPSHAPAFIPPGFVVAAHPEPVIAEPEDEPVQVPPDFIPPAFARPAAHARLGG